jgi:hypothetical protein
MEIVGFTGSSLVGKSLEQRKPTFRIGIPTAYLHACVTNHPFCAVPPEFTANLGANSFPSPQDKGNSNCLYFDPNVYLGSKMHFNAFLFTIKERHMVESIRAEVGRQLAIDYEQYIPVELSGEPS